MSLLEAKNIKKSYGNEEILKGINLKVNKDDFIMILGKSGEGKTTLLNILSTVDVNNVEGELLFNGENLLNKSDSYRTNFRKNNIGYIFQDFALIPEFNVLENVVLPLIVNKISKNEAIKKAYELLDFVEIPRSHFNKKPFELSGGQQQRVAIVRAIIKEPKILFADEPTGNLDEQSALKIVSLLKKVSQNRAVILITHTPNIFDEIENKKTFILKDGLLRNDAAII